MARATIHSVLISLPLLLACSCGSEDVEPDAGPTVDAEVPINFTFDHLVEACIRISACDVDRKPTLQDCVDNFQKRLVGLGQQGLYERLYDCANKGLGDCKVVRECLGFAGRPKTCDNTYTTKCVGDVAWKCDLRVTGGWEQALDCSKGKLKCAVKNTGTNTDATCGGGKCDKNKYKPQCINRKLHKCVGGAIEINDCPGQLLQCRDPAVESCEGTGRSCAVMTPTCSGASLKSCVYGYESVIDCTKLPGKRTCGTSTGTGSCVGTGNECGVAQSFFNTCVGDTLVACIDRYKRTFDCKKLGFLGCEVAGYGAFCKAAHVYE